MLECLRVEQVSLRYFSVFDYFALCCGFGGSAARAEIIITYDTATVLVTVTSQVALRPAFTPRD